MIRIASRGSQLALWQAEWVKNSIQQNFPSEQIEIITFKTQGDIILDQSLSKIGGKGLFVKELENALLNHEADIAVHSMKDVPFSMPEGLEISIYSKRENPFDAFVSNNYQDIHSIPAGKIIGTSSLRRQIQLEKLRPDIKIKSLRGNVNTRLRKLDEGEYDAIILAAAGLIRLNFEDRIQSILKEEESIPAVAQGVLGIQHRIGDLELVQKIQHINDELATITTSAERAFLIELEGNCQIPIGAYAKEDGEQISIKGFQADENGMNYREKVLQGKKSEAKNLGKQLALALK